MRLTAHSWFLPALAFAGSALLLVAFMAWNQTGFSAIALLLILLIASLPAGLTIRLQRSHRTRQALASQLQAAQARITSLINLNRELINAGDEQQWMDVTLKITNELMGTVACSFVPLDEWLQPMPALVQGHLPPVVLRSWAEHLAQPEVRQRCKDCTILKAGPGTRCPLLEGPFANTFSVYCLPLRRGKQPLGLLNLYLPANHNIPADLYAFLEGLLDEIALAFETIRLRRQEMNTLRQIQMLRAAQSDLPQRLEALLSSLQTMLEADALQLYIPSFSGQEQAPLQLRQGESPWLDSPAAQAFLNHLLDGQTSSLQETQSGEHVSAGVTITLPERPVLGALLITDRRSTAFSPRQIEMLRTIANQIALLVDHERTLLSLEYQAVIQERSRLAREIHDGLAQTLAFLKLQSAQMQTALGRNDLQRLDQLLKQNHAALTETYQDVRQAIDNLRQTPQAGLTNWIEMLASDFSAGSGLPVRRTFAPLPWQVSPEIEAQLIRIVQESLNNIRKHAHARQVWINVREWNDELVIEIGDDGQGFAPEDLPMLSQYGLRGMRERAELIGADFQITSQPQHGTVVRLQIPVHLEEPYP